MLTKGDLVRIPADTCLTQETSIPAELAMVHNYKKTNGPGIGIFIKYQNNKVKIFLENQFWLASKRDIRFMEASC